MPTRHRAGKVWIVQALACLLALAPGLNAFGPDLRITQYAHTSWTQWENELASAVHAITQTRDGSLWLGTEDGLIRFDGVTFSVWKPPEGSQLLDQRVLSLAAAPDGGLWIGTSKGLSYWKGDILRNYQTSDTAAGPSVGRILIDRSGTVWAGTVGYDSGSICRVEQEQLHCFAAADGYSGGGVLALAQDQRGELRIGAAKGVFRRDATGFHSFATGLVQAIAATPEAMVFGSNGGLQQAAGEHLTNYATHPSLQGVHVRHLLTDRHGALWVATTGEGLLHIVAGRVDRYTEADGLSGDTAFQPFEDREGNIWVGTVHGLDRFRELPVTTLTHREGLLEDTVLGVQESSQGGIWLATRVGLNHVADGVIRAYDTRTGLAGGEIRALAEDRSGTLWVDTAEQLAYLEGGRFYGVDLPDGQRIRSVYAATEDRDGALWLSDWEIGLVRIQGRRVTQRVPPSRFGNQRITAMAADSAGNGLLLGFAEGGVARYEGGNLTSRWETPGDVTQLLAGTGGSIWIATTAGLAQLRNDRVFGLTVQNGLPCDRIHAVVEDDDRNLWLNTACGLVRIDSDELDAWAANPVTQVQSTLLDARDGMHVRASKNGAYPGAAKSRDGRLWFAVFDGVAVVDPHAIAWNRVAPPVEVQSVIVDRKVYPLQAGLALPPIADGVEIDYTAFSFADPGAVRFKYRLEGYDRDWVDAGGRRQAFYPALGPRDYRFRVIASNNNGVWNETGASLDFQVAPRFYQTGWFRAASAASILALVWAAYRLRIRHVERTLAERFNERLQERTRIARDLHDTLLQNVVGLALRLDGVSKIVAGPESAKDSLRELRRDAESWIREVRQSVWDLRSDAREEDDLANAIRLIGQRITEGHLVQFHLGVSGTSRAVARETRENLQKIVQEAVRNAVEHSSATGITVHVNYGGEEMSIQIRDDGRGFDLDAASRMAGHMGLATMQERARNIGADLLVATSPGQGVTVEIRCLYTPRTKHRELARRLGLHR